MSSRAKSVASEAASTASRRAFAFVPEKPIDKQLSEIASNISQIEKLLVMDEETGKFEDENVESEIEEYTEKIAEGFQTFLDDLWHGYRHARRSAGAGQTDASQILSEELPRIETFFDEIRELQEKLMESTVAYHLKNDEILPVLKLYTEFVENLSNQFQETLWGYCTQCLNEKSSGADYNGYSCVVPTLIDRIINHQSELQSLHYKLVNAIYYSHINEDDEKDEGVDCEQESIALIGDPICSRIRESMKAKMSIVQELWIRDRFTVWESGDQNNEEEEGKEEEREYMDLGVRVFDMFEDQLKFIEKCVDTLNQWKKQPNEDEDEDEAAGVDPIEPFLTNEISALYAELMSMIRKMWRAAYNEDRVRDTAQYGVLIVDIIKSEIESETRDVSIVAIAGFLLQAAKYKCDVAFKEFLEILIELINDLLTGLEEGRKSELDTVTNVWSVFLDDDGEPLDDMTIEANKKELVEKYDGIYQSISESSGKVTEALRRTQHAVFVYRKHHDGEIKSETKSEKGEKSEAEVLTQIEEMDVSLNEKTFDYVSGLTKLLNKVYTDVISEKSETGSVVSKKDAQKAARSRATRKKVNEHLTDEEKMQVQLIEKSIVRTYEELFASLRNLIMTAIRNLDSNVAVALNEELKKQQLKYAGFLDDVRKACIDAMDIQGAKDAEERIASSQSFASEIIIKCLEESFKDVIDQAIDKYWDNLDEIEDIYQAKELTARKNFENRCSEIDKQEHNQALVLIEKQYILERHIEAQRVSSAAVQVKETIKKLIAQKKYDEAQQEKKKLAVLEEQERKEREKQVDRKFEKLRQQKLAQQARDLKNFEKSLEMKLEHLKLKEKDERDEQTKMLSSSIRSITQRFVSFATALSDQKIRKDMCRRLDKIARDTLKEHDLTGICINK